MYHKCIHRLVLDTYVGKCPEKMECCHNDGNRKNNNLSNLRWDTRSNNHYDAVKHGTFSGLKNKGEKHPMAKLTEKNVRIIICIYRTGLFSQQKISEMYGVCRQNITAIVTKKSWRHLWTQ